MTLSRGARFPPPLIAALTLLLAGLAGFRYWEVQGGSESGLNPRPELLVEPRWLADRLTDPGQRIVDLRSVEQYAAGHIPGAVRFEVGALYAEREGIAGMLPEPEALQESIRAAGIAPDTVVIAYDNRDGLSAARLFWALDVVGQGNGRLLNGGWPGWAGGGFPVSRDPVRVPRSNFTARLQPEKVVDRAWMEAHLHDEQTAFVDARSPAEYEGSRSGSKRSGHIPSAFSMEWRNHLDPQQGGRFLDPGKLVQWFAALGVTPDKEVATYCQSHTRASHTYFTLRWLGFDNVRGYDGSWSEWGNRDDTPIETGPPRTRSEASPAAAAPEVSELAIGISEVQARRLLGAPADVEEQNPCWGRQAVWNYPPGTQGAAGGLRLIFLDGLLQEIRR